MLARMTIPTGFTRLIRLLWVAVALCRVDSVLSSQPQSPSSLAANSGVGNSVTTVTVETLRKDWQRNRTGKDSLDAFLADLSVLSNHHGQVPLLSQTHSKRDSSFTKSWTNADWEHHQVHSFNRYKRHLASWGRSPTASAVLHSVLALLVWSVLVFVLAHSSSRANEFMARASFATGLGSFTAPISLLLALRTNRALNRLLEARSKWGIMLRAASSIAGLSATYVAPVDDSKSLLMGRYLSLLGWALKGYLREEDTEATLRMLLPPEEAIWVIQAPSDAPTAILIRLRQLVASSIHELPLTASQAMEFKIGELESVLGVCKRLIGSPIPPTYTRHTSRVLCLYLGLLPIALVASKATLVSILVNISLLSYVLIGIDEIGVEIEHPFPLLPMYHLSKALQKNIGNQFLLGFKQPDKASEP